MRKEFAFERLKVWSDIRQLVKDIYVITSKFPTEERFGLTNQARKSVISISSNLAEGSARKSSKDQAHFYQISYSSLMELLSQIIASLDLNYLDQSEYEKLRISIESISAQLNALYNSALKRANQV